MDDVLPAIFPTTTARDANDAPAATDTTEPHDTAGVIAPPPTIPLAFLLVGGILNRCLPAPLLPERWRALGGVLIGAGAAGEVWFFATMQEAKTPLNPAKPTERIVTHGPFRFSRNPSYVCFTLIYLGVACLTNNRWPALLWPAMTTALTKGVIEREERYLEAKFGDEYREYRARVRRWL